MFGMSNTVTANATIKALSPQAQQEMIQKNIWKKECPVPLERLRVVHFEYYNFNQELQKDGEIVVLDAVAKRVRKIFDELKVTKFPLSKAKRIEFYNGDDELSMADNNSSSFNCREITGGGAPSIHSYGLAIDINPVENPYISFNEADDKRSVTAKIIPSAGAGFINRTNLRTGMVESIVDIFKHNGFTIWGGKWNTPIDWQHFQTPRSVAKLLAAMDAKDAEDFFEIYIKHQALLNTLDPKDDQLIDLYKHNPKKFMETILKNPQILDLSDFSEGLQKLKQLILQ
jgi:hypothetical protein